MRFNFRETEVARGSRIEAAQNLDTMKNKVKWRLNYFHTSPYSFALRHTLTHREFCFYIWRLTLIIVISCLLLTRTSRTRIFTNRLHERLYFGTYVPSYPPPPPACTVLRCSTGPKWQCEFNGALMRSKREGSQVNWELLRKSQVEWWLQIL